jgi:hypothetical protein
LQVVFIDPHGEYWTFAEKFDVAIVGGEKGDLMLAEECMSVYGEVFKQGKSIDFNLREFMDDEIAYSRIVEKIFRTLWKTLVNDPRACLVVFEEAQGRPCEEHRYWRMEIRRLPPKILLGLHFTEYLRCLNVSVPPRAIPLLVNNRHRIQNLTQTMRDLRYCASTNT